MNKFKTGLAALLIAGSIAGCKNSGSGTESEYGKPLEFRTRPTPVEYVQEQTIQEDEFKSTIAGYRVILADMDEDGSFDMVAVEKIHLQHDFWEKNGPGLAIKPVSEIEYFIKEGYLNGPLTASAHLVTPDSMQQVIANHSPSKMNAYLDRCRADYNKYSTK